MHYIVVVLYLPYLQVLHSSVQAVQRMDDLHLFVKNYALGRNRLSQGQRQNLMYMLTLLRGNFNGILTTAA